MKIFKSISKFKRCKKKNRVITTYIFFSSKVLFFENVSSVVVKKACS